MAARLANMAQTILVKGTFMVNVVAQQTAKARSNRWRDAAR
jgi:hypothetical protein